MANQSRLLSQKKLDTLEVPWPSPNLRTAKLRGRASPTRGSITASARESASSRLNLSFSPWISFTIEDRVSPPPSSFSPDGVISRLDS